MTELLYFSISDVSKERKYLNKHLIDNKILKSLLLLSIRALKLTKDSPLEIELINSSKAFKVTTQLSYVLTYFTG